MNSFAGSLGRLLAGWRHCVPKFSQRSVAPYGSVIPHGEVVELVEIPQMETGAPLPEIEIIGTELRCAYICSNPDFPGWDSGADLDHIGFDEYCAVIEFQNVSSYNFGAPNDEALYHHPLYKLGADYYGFYKFKQSPDLKLQKDDWFWVATFHDETLQVAARSFRVVSSRVNTNSPKKALEVVK